jgi:hypothetical protein
LPQSAVSKIRRWWWSVLRTYSLKHDKRGEVEPLLRAYNRILIWMSIGWKKVRINGKDQFRLLPVYSKDNQFRRCLSI